MSVLDPSASPEAPTAAPPPRRGEARRRDLVERLGGDLRLVPVLLVLAVIWIFFASQNSVFLGSRNLSNLSAQIATTAVVALGLVFVLIVAEIDLSVAALSAVCGGITARLVTETGLPAGGAIAIGVAAGATVGLVQGSITTAFGAPAFIVTLGGGLAMQGLLLVLLPGDTENISLAGTAIQDIAGTTLAPGLAFALVAVTVTLVGFIRWQDFTNRRAAELEASLPRQVVAPTALLGAVMVAAVVMFDSYKGTPTPLAIVLALLAAGWVLTTQTRFGTYLYAIGNNPEAARRAGIGVIRVKLLAFVLVGALAAVGGIIASSRVLGVSPQSADSTLLLEAVAAAVIGGASLFGGRGSVWAALVGALIIGSIANGMFLINASTQVRYAVEGGILVLAVVMDSLLSRSGRGRT